MSVVLTFRVKRQDWVDERSDGVDDVPCTVPD